MKVDISKMDLGIKHYGFYLNKGDHEVFIETSYKRKCKPLLKEICRELQIPDNAEAFDALKYYMRPATAELKAISNGRKYFDFCGENFVYGDFVDNGNTEYYILEK